MRLNFFDWIREGVKQSVLLGVCDAAEHIGNKAEAEEFSNTMLESFTETKLVTDSKSSEGKRKPRKKSLGRSLSNIVEERAA